MRLITRKYSIDLQCICRSATKNAAFIVDLNVLSSDLKADDLGTWNATFLSMVWCVLLLESQVAA